MQHVKGMDDLSLLCLHQLENQLIVKIREAREKYRRKLEHNNTREVACRSSLVTGVEAWTGPTNFNCSSTDATRWPLLILPP